MMTEQVLLLRAPLSGRTVQLKDVPDPVFAQGMVGDGIAIAPETGEVRAPLDAKVAVLVPTGHALALRTPDGVEVLIHVGIDTVKLAGLFTPHVAVGDEVKAGDLLVTFDLAEVERRAASPLSPVVVTALPAGMALAVAVVDRPVMAGRDPILTLTARAQTA